MGAANTGADEALDGEAGQLGTDSGAQRAPRGRRAPGGPERIPRGQTEQQTTDPGYRRHTLHTHAETLREAAGPDQEWKRTTPA
ncbi:hypothetical protein GCM10023079_56410 [Streptomyces chitinivorans]